jgi:tetratricopeptide (TPR) repeat protein
MEGYALYNLGRANLELGQSAEAARLLEQALTIHRAVGDRSGEAQDLRHIGIAHARAGRVAEARGTWTLARGLYQGLGEDKEAADLDAQLEKLPQAGPSGH